MPAPFLHTAADELVRQAEKQNKPVTSPPSSGRPVKIPTFSTPYIGSVFTKNKKEEEHDGIKGIDKKLVDIIENEIMNTKKNMSWDDIAGLKTAKEAINYAVIAPMKRPDLFTGIRSAPKGVLLFGPPGLDSLNLLIFYCLLRNREDIDWKVYRKSSRSHVFLDFCFFLDF